MTDAETSAAIEALEYRVKARDEAIRNGEDYPDAGPFALEFMTALRGQGWRLTKAKAKPDPHTPGAGLPKRDDVVAAVAELKARFAAAADPDEAA